MSLTNDNIVMMIIGIGLIITKLVITIHLGINPRRGGRPPIDKKLIMIM